LDDNPSKESSIYAHQELNHENEQSISSDEIKEVQNDKLNSLENNKSYQKEPFDDIKWQKGSLIGQGGFGKVYHALNLDTGEIMAVKQVLLGPESKSRKKKEDALQREIDLLRELNHEHIVRYFGSQSSETSFNVFLEYVSGGSISSILQKYGKFDETLARSMTCQILFGLQYLHSKSIIHRDIKGANSSLFSTNI
jgi:serine/threonine protein kinase